ncbi:MAG: hypothetical protein B6I29_01695 [Marinitoga sp. 4572_148]|nr:MAG: hypothetical protein B6I29_01695 [Marinitoga sp. 4572_148]
MKKVFLIMMLIFAISMFSINFGGGGYKISFIPKDQVNQINPLKNTTFGDLILHGGGGMGVMPNGSYLGGEGFGGSTTSGDFMIIKGVGNFIFGRHINIFNVLGIDVGMGIGGGETVIKRKVESSRNGKTISDFENNINSVPYVVELKREELSISPRVTLHINMIEFLSIILEGRFTYNYSPENWKIEGEYPITEKLPNYNYYYSFGAGVMWGF